MDFIEPLPGGLLLLLLFGLSAFFSGSETALTATNLPRMTQLMKQGDRRAAIVVSLLERRERVIGVLLFFNNLVNIAIASLTTVWLVSIFGEYGIGLATIIVTLLLVVFAEFLPKSWAIRRPDPIALRVSVILRSLVALASPLVGGISFVNLRFLNWIAPISSNKEAIQEQEEALLGAIHLHESDDEITTLSERRMLRAVLDLDELMLEAILTPLGDVEFMDLSKPIDQVMQQLRTTSHTRLPTHRGDPQVDMVGVLHVRRAMQGLLPDNIQSANDPDELLAPYIALPVFVHDTKTVHDQLLEFRGNQNHLALVVDEYGVLRGIVTLEDVLEEIVGEIDDETDPISQSETIDAGLVFKGATTLRSINREKNWDLPDQEASTLSELVLQQTRSIPTEGESLFVSGYCLTVVRRRRQRLVSIAIMPPSEAKYDVTS